MKFLVLSLLVATAVARPQNGDVNVEKAQMYYPGMGGMGGMGQMGGMDMMMMQMMQQQMMNAPEMMNFNRNEAPEAPKAPEPVRPLARDPYWTLRDQVIMNRERGIPTDAWQMRLQYIRDHKIDSPLVITPLNRLHNRDHIVRTREMLPSFEEDPNFESLHRDRIVNIRDQIVLNRNDDQGQWDQPQNPIRDRLPIIRDRLPINRDQDQGQWDQPQFPIRDRLPIRDQAPGQWEQPLRPIMDRINRPSRPEQLPNVWEMPDEETREQFPLRDRIIANRRDKQYDDYY